MASMSSDAKAVNARILYWGIDGAGKTTNLHSVHRKLRADHRGDIEREATRIDPSVSYETLAIELGEIAGLRTRIQMTAVPGGAEQAPTRKQLLDQVDGVVLVVDSRRERIDENAASLAELRSMLLEYGRNLDDVPLVLQYNKRDLADPYALEALHRKLDVNGAAVFEAVATESTGVLQTLATLAKHVVRSLRGQQFASGAEAPSEGSVASAESTPERIASPPLQPQPQPDDRIAGTPAARMEHAMLAEAAHPEASALDELAASAETLLDAPWEDLADERPIAGAQLGAEFSIASVGEATRSGERGVRVPIVVRDKAGSLSELVLSIQIDPRLAREGD